MAETVETFANIIGTFQTLDTVTRAQIMKTIKNIDTQIIEAEKAKTSAVNTAVATAVATAVEAALKDERAERDATEKTNIEKAVAEAIEQDRKSHGNNPKQAAESAPATNKPAATAANTPAKTTPAATAPAPANATTSPSNAR